MYSRPTHSDKEVGHGLLGIEGPEGNFCIKQAIVYAVSFSTREGRHIVRLYRGKCLVLVVGTDGN